MSRLDMKVKAPYKVVKTLSAIEIEEFRERPRRPAGWYADVSYVDAAGELLASEELGPFETHWEACQAASQLPGKVVA